MYNCISLFSQTGGIDMNTFADRLVAARKAKGISQEKLAKAASVSRKAVSSWERGRSVPGEDLLQRLSEILGCGFAPSDAQTVAESTVEKVEASEAVAQAAAPDDAVSADSSEEAQSAAPVHAEALPMEAVDSLEAETGDQNGEALQFGTHPVRTAWDPYRRRGFGRRGWEPWRTQF